MDKWVIFQVAGMEIQWNNPLMTHPVIHLGLFVHNFGIKVNTRVEVVPATLTTDISPWTINMSVLVQLFFPWTEILGQISIWHSLV